MVGWLAGWLAVDGTALQCSRFSNTCSNCVCACVCACAPFDNTNTSGYFLIKNSSLKRKLLGWMYCVFNGFCSCTFLFCRCRCTYFIRFFCSFFIQFRFASSYFSKCMIIVMRTRWLWQFGWGNVNDVAIVVDVVAAVSNDYDYDDDVDDRNGK